MFTLNFILTTVLLLSLFLISGINCLRCQVCDSTLQNDCSDVFINPNNKYYQQCPSNSNYCVKTVANWYSTGLQLVKRSCETTCISSSNSQPGYQTNIYCCQTDGCNSSNLHKPFIKLFWFVIVVHYLKYLL